jgi:hypothetical protein
MILCVSMMKKYSTFSAYDTLRFYDEAKAITVSAQESLLL